jgi:hypothetical protein
MREIREPAERLRLAFLWIEHERGMAAGQSVDDIIERAADRFELTAPQLMWVRWSLHPTAVAVQPKEPVQ